MDERTMQNFPWNALIWFILATVIVFALEMKREVLQASDPEKFPKRRLSLLVYAIVIAAFNMAQISMWIEFISFFNYTITALLFLRFWFIEDGAKKKVARNMFLMTLALALLSLLGQMQIETALNVAPWLP